MTIAYRRCGKWGLELPVLSLGAWQTVGGYEAAGAARAIFLRAFEWGITHFDFANNYGREPGVAEVEGGKILRELPRDEIVISTKAGYRMWPGPYGEWGSRKHLIASCDQSLGRLGVEYVDIFYSHRFDPSTALEETLGALNSIVQQGKALYAGISGYNGEQTKRAVDICNREGWAPIVVHQPYYNVLDRGIETDLLPVTRQEQMGVIVFSPLKQGLLSGSAGSRRSQTITPWRVTAPDPATRAKVDRLATFARQRGQSLAQLALAWCLHRPEVTSVLTAVSTLEQLEANLRALERIHFTDDELWHIGELAG